MIASQGGGTQHPQIFWDPLCTFIRFDLKGQNLVYSNKWGRSMFLWGQPPMPPSIPQISWDPLANVYIRAVLNNHFVFTSVLNNGSNDVFMYDQIVMLDICEPQGTCYIRLKML